jgi:hypothetical protein
MPLPTPQTDLACVPKVIGWTVLFQENMSSVLVIEGGGAVFTAEGFGKRVAPL